jgi:hypothetical protein
MPIENKRTGAGAAAFDASHEQALTASLNTIFDKYPVGSWTVGGQRIVFPVVSIGESGSNRLVERERPYRDGAKLDDTGSKAKRWEIEVLFENSISEPGLSTTRALYPTVLNDLIASFDRHDTGDLVVPTRGTVRARASSYERRESAEVPDAASLTLSFVEDNEDSIDRRAFESPSANADARRLGEQTTFDAQSQGIDSFSLADLNEFAAGLEAIANAPGDLLIDLDSQAAIVIGATNRVIEAFTRPSQDGRDLLDDPSSSRTQRKLERMKELTYKSKEEARRGRPRVVTVAVMVDTSIVRLAGFLEQSMTDLIAINPQIVNPLFIPAGSQVRVFVFDAAPT